MYYKTPIFIAIILFSISTVSHAKYCKEYKSCAEVISDYPSGRFGIRDRDDDGIPCENVCKSKKQVEDLLNSISGSAKEKDKKMK